MKDNCEEFIVKLSKLEREQEEELKVSVQSVTVLTLRRVLVPGPGRPAGEDRGTVRASSRDQTGGKGWQGVARDTAGH